MTPRQLSMLATEYRYANDPKASRPLAEQARRPETQGTAAFAMALGALAQRSKGMSHGPTA
jgi:hypothetical protein